MMRKKSAQTVWVSDNYAKLILRMGQSQSLGTLKMAWYLPTALNGENRIDLLHPDRIGDKLKVDSTDVINFIKKLEQEHVAIELENTQIYFINPHYIWNSQNGDETSDEYKRYCLLWDIAVAEQELDDLHPLKTQLDKFGE